MAEKKIYLQYIAAITAAYGAFTVGTSLGWTNPVQDDLKSETIGLFSVSNEEFSWVASILNLAAAAISIPIGFLIHKIGRRIVQLSLAIPFVLGWTLLMFAPSLWTLYLGRACLGLACGGYCVSTPMYISEIASPKIRGAQGSLFQLMITLGILFVFCVGAFVGSRLLSGICGLMPVLFLIFFIFMPESPLFYIHKNQEEKAIESLQRLRGKNYDYTDELNDFKATDNGIRDRKLSLKDAFSTTPCRRALMICVSLIVFHQLCGINIVIFYSTEIFSLSSSNLQPRFSTIIVGIMHVLATLCAVIFVDRLGRRILLLASSGFMAISTLGLAIYFYLNENHSDTVKGYGWMPLTALCIFIVMFSFGLGPVPWLMLGELFPPEIKGPAGSIVGTTNWILAFVVTKVYVNFKEALGAGEIFGIFSLITTLGFIFILFLVPETKGKSLNEIQEMLEQKKKRGDK